MWSAKVLCLQLTCVAAVKAQLQLLGADMVGVWPCAQVVQRPKDHYFEEYNAPLQFGSFQHGMALKHPTSGRLRTAKSLKSAFEILNAIQKEVVDGYDTPANLLLAGGVRRYCSA